MKKTLTALTLIALCFFQCHAFAQEKANDPGVTNISLLAPPGELAKMPDPDAHFDFVLEHIAERIEYFNYLKGRYFVMPLLRKGLMPDISPDPKTALVRIQKYIDRLEPTIRVSLKQLSEGVAIAELEQPDKVRAWFYLTAALAYGKRTVNKTGEDGGAEYIKIFSFSKALKNEPHIFSPIVGDFCQIAVSPMSSPIQWNIRQAKGSIERFLPEWFSMNSVPTQEVYLSQLYPDILNTEILNRTFESIPTPDVLSFPVLSRILQFFIECSKNEEAEITVLLKEIHKFNDYYTAFKQHDEFIKMNEDELGIYTDFIHVVEAVGKHGIVNKPPDQDLQTEEAVEESE